MLTWSRRGAEVSRLQLIVWSWGWKPWRWVKRQVEAGSGGIAGDLGFTLSVMGVGSAQQPY